MSQDLPPPPLPPLLISLLFSLPSPSPPLLSLPSSSPLPSSPSQPSDDVISHSSCLVQPGAGNYRINGHLRCHALLHPLRPGPPCPLNVLGDSVKESRSVVLRRLAESCQLEWNLVCMKDKRMCVTMQRTWNHMVHDLQIKEGCRTMPNYEVIRVS